MSESQMDVSGGCDFYGPVQGVESRPCNAAARERVVVDEGGDSARVALCDDHFGYVSAPTHAHYWFVDRTASGSRTFIRLAGRHE